MYMMKRMHDTRGLFFFFCSHAFNILCPILSFGFFPSVFSMVSIIPGYFVLCLYFYSFNNVSPRIRLCKMFGGVFHLIGGITARKAKRMDKN